MISRILQDQKDSIKMFSWMLNVLLMTQKKHSNGIKGPSVLMFCPKFDRVNSVAKDYMHLIHLGINRMLMKLWFSSEYLQEAYSLHKDIKVVDHRLSKTEVPHFITRTP